MHLQNKEQPMKKSLAIASLLAGLAAAPLALSHLDPTQFNLSYRQSVYALLGANFGPMASMIKGEIPWNAEQFQAYSEDLATVASLNISRGFPPGSQGGRTRAKPALWENTADFEEKLEALRTESTKMALVAASGDRQAILQQFQKTGGTCKNCHDEYKSKEYLN
jgi:cytochrome c556